MKNIDLKFLFVLVLPFFLVTNSWAEVYRYVDSSGGTHFVSNASEVPAQYQDQVKASADLPNLSRGSFGDSESSEIKAVTPPVTLLVTSWCGYCRKAENFFKAEGVRYKRLDVEKSSAGKKRYEELGGGGVPVILIGSDIHRGFNAPVLRQALGR